MKSILGGVLVIGLGSPSAWKVWIEINWEEFNINIDWVTFRMEGVD